jgi:hypothetical protein
MDSLYFNKSIQELIMYAESYMDFYLSYPLLEQNLKDYFDVKTFDTGILSMLDHELEVRDLNSESESSDDENIEDEQKMSNSINRFINEVIPFYNFNKSKSKVKEDIYLILMSSTTLPKNLCCVCGSDMGIDNPRQLCRKYYCPFSD